MFLENFIHYYEKYLDEFFAIFRELKEKGKKFFSSHPFLKILTLNALSAILLILAFPRYDLWLLAWVALVPFFFNLDEKKPIHAFGIGYILGVMFFFGVFYWLFYVTVLGMTLMVLYCALYFGVFGFYYSYFSKRKTISKFLLYPAVWAVLEYIRTYFLTGFGWGALGYSQYKNLVLIQISEITGAFGVSFLVLMVNYVAKEYFRRSFLRRSFRVKERFKRVMRITFVILIVVFIYGIIQLNSFRDQKSITVGIVQANIEQDRKWINSEWPFILEEYQALTEELILEGSEVDWVIWPETAFPGFIWQKPEMFEGLKSFVARNKTPLLLGAVTKIKNDFYNSALLLSEKGEIIKKYNKLHLVPFGEYIPFRRRFPFLAEIVPIIDFSAGKEWVVFDQKGNKFSVLICFEDGVPRIAREFVQKGANYLINITNDAWFEDTIAPFMHVQSSVFRAIENRRSVIRSANTGVSCIIDRSGKVKRILQNEKGQKTFLAGYLIEQVYYDDQISFYTKFGDIFTFLCFGCILVCIGIKE